MPRIWRCQCPICRVLVHKVLNRVYGELSLDNIESITAKQQVKPTSTIEELKKKYPVQEVKVASLPNQSQEQSQQPSLPPSSPNLNVEPQSPPQLISNPPSPQTSSPTTSTLQNEESGTEESREDVGKVRVEIPKEVLERIESLENEIDKIKTYVRASIDSVKATLVDLRSAMAELSNPFNILRKYADIFFGAEEQEEKSKKEEKSSQQQYPAFPPVVPVVYPITGAPVISVQQVPANTMGPTNGDTMQNLPEAPSSSKKEAIEPVNGNGKPRIPFSVYTKLVNWANNVIKKIPPDKFDDIIDAYIDIGLLDETTGNALKKLIKLIKELGDLGITPEEQIMILKGLIEGLNERSTSSSTKRNLNESDIVTPDSLQPQITNSLVKSSKKEEKKDSKSSAQELLELIGGE